MVSKCLRLFWTWVSLDGHLWVCPHSHMPTLVAFTQWHFLPQPSCGPYQYTHHIYNQYIVLDDHFCWKCPFLWTEGAQAGERMWAIGQERAPLQWEMAPTGKYFLLRRCPRDMVSWPLKTTCRHVWERKDGEVLVCRHGRGRRNPDENTKGSRGRTGRMRWGDRALPPFSLRVSPLRSPRLHPLPSLLVSL